MDTNNLIKSVIQENVVETKKLVNDLLMQKLSERLQAKFDEYAPETFLDNINEDSDETEEVSDKIQDETEELDEEANERRSEIVDLLEKKKHKKMKKEKEEDEEEEEEDEDEEDEDEEMGEDGLVYEDGEEECDNCKQENNAEELNKKAFKKSSLSEDTEQLDEVSPPGLKHMTHSKKATKAFKEKYGKRGKEVKYATAWKMSKHEE